MSDPTINRVSRAELTAVFKSEKLVRVFERLLATVAVETDVTAIQQALEDHVLDTSDAHQASAIGAVPGGIRAAITVQGQLVELDSGKGDEYFAPPVIYEAIQALTTEVAGLAEHVTALSRQINDIQQGTEL